MLKRIFSFIFIGLLLISLNGCAVIGTALSLAASYGIYQLTNKD